MVIGWLAREEPAPGNITSSPWKQVQAAQLDPELPCLLVPQPAHAVLAGDLAEALLPEIFGELPREIKQAILMHDTGWAMIDAAQIHRLRSDAARADETAPVSFIANSAEEVVQAWTASINSVERLTAAGGLVVSRHFTLLAMAHHPEHRRFIASERSRQQRLEVACAAATAAVTRQLVKWTAALGFCDLLSLYLVCGFSGETSFQLAHPSSPEARSAPRATLQIENNLLRFQPPVFSSGMQMEIEAMKHPVPEEGPRTEHLRWEIA